MRILKKSSVVLAGCLLIGSLTGCTDAQNNYYNELKQASLWEQAQFTQAIDANIEVPGVQMLLTVQSTGEMNQKTSDGVVDGNVTVTLVLDDALEGDNSVQAEAGSVTPEATEANPLVETISIDMGACIEDQQMYLSKDYYKQILQQMGMTAMPAIDSVEADYIGIEGMTDLQGVIRGDLTYTGDEEAVQINVLQEWLNSYMNEEVDGEQLFAFYKTIAQTAGLDIPVVQEGNTYTVDLDEVQLVEVLLDTCDTSVANMEELNTLLELQLTEEMVAGIREAYATERENIEEMIPMLGMLLDAKFVVCTEKLADGSLQTTTQLSVQPAPEVAPFMEQQMGGKLLIDMKMTYVTKPVPVTDITSGLSKAILPLETFSNYFTTAVVDESTAITY